MTRPGSLDLDPGSQGSPRNGAVLLRLSVLSYGEGCTDIVVCHKVSKLYSTFQKQRFCPVYVDVTGVVNPTLDIIICHKVLSDQYWL